MKYKIIELLEQNNRLAILNTKMLKKIQTLYSSNKELMNIKELSTYTGWSLSSIYKQTAALKLPYYKQNVSAKKLYFLRTEIDKVMIGYKAASCDEIEQAKNNYFIKKNIKNV